MFWSSLTPTASPFAPSSVGASSARLRFPPSDGDGGGGGGGGGGGAVVCV